MMDGHGIGRRGFLKNASALAMGAAMGGLARGQDQGFDPAQVRSYNESMEYRRLGKTGLWVSAVCLGGHWKRLTEARGTEWDLPSAEARDAFIRNRTEVVSCCIDHGINYVDACSTGEVVAYAEALRGRRESMYLGASFYENELRFEEWRTRDKLIEGFDNGLRLAGLEYVDIWRVTSTMNEPLPDEVMEEMVAAFLVVHEQGKARHLGMSSHHHDYLKHCVETWPEIAVVLFPYTANSKERPEGSLFEALRAKDVGSFGIKPFASNSIFRGDSQLGSPTAEEDDRLARMTLRYILASEAVTAPIPGLINTHQVENAVAAVRERRELDIVERAQLAEAGARMNANLPEDYQWLRDWEWV